MSGPTPGDVPSGATIRTAYVEREVKAYAVFENEVKTISMWNTLAGVFASTGAATSSFAIGIWTSASFVDKLTPEGAVLSRFAAPGLCVVTVILWSLAIWAIVSRARVWSAIRKESKQPAAA
jgi:hypothetical protein